MDRVNIQLFALPLDTDILSTNRNAMVGLGMALQAILGAGPNVDGLPCMPGAGLAVNIGPGSIYVSAPIDQTAYGSLPADTTDLIVQQGITFGETPLSVPAPTTAGQSINYLIEAQFQQVDSEPVALLYYNSDNPLQPLQGTATNTKRGGVCALQVKAGTPATTGTQTTPAPDAGWTGLYVVTVPYGAASLTQGEIALYPGAPFISTKLGGFMQTYAGNPNGFVAGNAGTVGLTVPSLVWDTTDTVLWACTTSGTASTAVWTRLTGGLSGLGIGWGLKNDGAGNLAVKLADASMRVTVSGLQGNEPITPLSGAVNVTAANHFANFVGTGALNLAQTATLWNGFCFSVSALSGTVTLNPDADDGINGGGAGAAYVLQQGSTATFKTDADGNWWIFDLSVPALAQTGSPYNYAYITAFVI
ncbi:hypothetical protein PQR71_39935 [Paraburkholderia fungorum]|uniref:hypothetical protein n=1 Tax=Paraburkholderia fungorum TaxID=134537 RepID=UPI0038BB015B